MASADPSLSSSDQRLNVIRSRASRSLYSQTGVPSYTSDRGPITTMRLLKGPDYDPAAAVKGQSVDVSSDVTSLLSSSGFSSFFVTGVNVSYNEKVQIMTTFGDNEVVYYFGKQPIMFNISGLLFDSMENAWFGKFLTLYASILRGSQLAINFGLVELTFPNMRVIGTISNLTTQQESSRDTDIAFSMQFIAKEVVPLPIVLPAGKPVDLLGTLVDFSANRTGISGYSLSSGSLGGGFVNSAINRVVDSALAPLNISGGSSSGSGISGVLDSFRSSIFSPIVGIISSITKIVKTATGTISSIISSFTNPLNQILRDITSVATQAASVALMVESSINSVINIPSRTITNLNNTLLSLKGAAGIISRVPEDISQNFKRHYSTGNIKAKAAILSSGKNHTKSKAAVLSSGTPYQPTKSNTLNA